MDGWMVWLYVLKPVEVFSSFVGSGRWLNSIQSEVRCGNVVNDRAPGLKLARALSDAFPSTSQMSQKEPREMASCT